MMTILYIILVCISVIAADVDYKFENDKYVYGITRQEWDQMKEELSELKAVRREIKEMLVLKQQVKEIDILKQKVKEIDHLKQQMKEINVLKQQVKEIGLLKQQVKTLTQDNVYMKRQLRIFESAVRKSSDMEISRTVPYNSTKPKNAIDKQATQSYTGHVKTNKNSRFVKRLLYPFTTQIPTPPSLNQIAFCAELSHALSNLGTFHTIVYDHVITNFGNAYNKNDGIFTAPVEGIYVFSWTTMTKPNSYQGTELVLDGSHVSYSYATGTSGYTSTSKTVVLHLHQGNEVWIRTNGETSSGHYLHEFGYNSFVGFLLK